MIILRAVLILLMLSFSAHAVPTASRTSGVAPLAVHFWADVAASSSGNMPYHDYEYSWNFGDSTSGTWGTSGKSKNTDKGPVAAHVYETPGTYTATLTVRNPNTGSTTSTSSFEITVTNPDTVYATTKTTCISTGTDFTGCPSGATQLANQSSLPNLATYTDAGERVLLRRGDSWTVSSYPGFAATANNGPVHIGAYGTCTSPDSQGICSNAPSITLQGSASYFLNASNKTDWRVVDITFTNSQGASGPILWYAYEQAHNHLVMRVKQTGGAFGLHFTGTPSFTKNSFVDNNITGIYDYPGYFAGEKMAIIGNIFADSTDGHVVRVWQGYQTILSHNRISGAGLSASNQSALKFHSTDYGDGYANSQFIVASYNTFGQSGSSAFPVGFGPQGAEPPQDERLSDILFEHNRMHSDYGTAQSTSTQPVQNFVSFNGRYITARNNIFDVPSRSETWFSAFRIFAQQQLEPASTGIRIYNNTINATANFPDGGSVVQVLANVLPDVIVRNNYVYVPNGADVVMIEDVPGSVTSSNNVLRTTTPNFIDPTNANPLLRNFAITSSATAAINQGYTVPVRDDYLGNIRSGLSYDVGAFEYGASGEDSEDATAPITTISTSDPSSISSDSLTVTGSSSDSVGVSGCKWRIGSAPDASNGTACTGTTSFSCSTSGYTSGSNTLYVGCYDAAGNYGSDSMVVNYSPSTVSLGTVLLGR